MAIRFDNVVIPATGTISLSNAKITLNNQVYTGKAIRPSVVVELNSKALQEGKDYIVKYQNNKKVGVANVTVTGTGDYSDFKKKTFKIVPKSTTIRKLKNAKKAFTVKWKKQGIQATGYQVQYCTNKDFKSGKKTVTVKGIKVTSVKISRLKSNKKYYVRVRTYKTVSREKYYSTWSKVKTVKTK